MIFAHDIGPLPLQQPFHADIFYSKPGCGGAEYGYSLPAKIVVLNELSEENLNSPYALFLLIAGIKLTEKILRSTSRS